MEIAALALVIATASALRGMWSPCGLSMLSTITPMAERSRGHRYGVTAAWFVLGGLVGGAALGLITAGLAAAVAAVDPSPTALLATGAVLAAVAAVVDSGVLGVRPPFFKRQVDDAWLSTYRAWVYGLGFGVQIGFGLATYIMTTGVLLTVALAALTASPTTAFALCVAFGGVRGLLVLVGARASSPEALGRLHARIDALEAPVRWGLVALLGSVSLVLAIAAAGPLAAVGVIVACAVALAIRLPLGLGSPRVTEDPSPAA